MMVVSRAISEVPSISDAMMITSLRPVGYCTGSIFVEVSIAEVDASAAGIVLLVVSSCLAMFKGVADANDGWKRISLQILRSFLE